MISNNKGHLELFYPNFSSLGICELEYITLTFAKNKRNAIIIIIIVY